MEESEKRKARLKAIRMEAAEAGPQSSTGEPFNHGLTNPLVESPSVFTEPNHRFGYYTDPMAAFSANKKSNSLSPSPSPRVQQSFNTPPRQMNTGSPAYYAQGSGTPVRRPYWPRGANATPLGIGGRNSPSGTPPGNSSNYLGSPFATPNNCIPPRSPQIGSFSSQGFPRGGVAGRPYGRGSPNQDSRFRGSSYGRGSPNQDSRFRGSPLQGSGRGRGRSMYYDKSMVEDPWELLKPVIWKPRFDTRNSLKSWPQKSTSSKKSKLEETSPIISTPQQSLAEYLASAFNDAAGEEPVNDESGK